VCEDCEMVGETPVMEKIEMSSSWGHRYDLKKTPMVMNEHILILWNDIVVGEVLKMRKKI
jgi:hypothetical protein